MKDAILKPLISLVLATMIGSMLAVMSSHLLDTILESRGLAGAAGGLFSTGIFDATLTAIIGGLLFGYVFAFHPGLVARAAIGSLLGAVIGLIFATSYSEEACVRLLGVSFFLGYGALWGSLGGAVFASVIRRAFVLARLTPSVLKLPKFFKDRNLVITSVVSLVAACIPIALGGNPAAPSREVYVVTASFSSCSEAEQASGTLKTPSDVYDVRIIHTINGQYGVSIGVFNGQTARRTLVSAVERGIISRDSFLVTRDSVIKDYVRCRGAAGDA